MVAGTSKKEFAERLNKALDLAGYRRAPNLAKLVAGWFGLSRESGRKWLAGESMPNTDRIAELASRTGVRGEWLLTGSPPMSVDHERVSASTDGAENVSPSAIRLMGSIERAYANGSIDDAVLDSLTNLVETLAKKQGSTFPGLRKMPPDAD